MRTARGYTLLDAMLGASLMGVALGIAAPPLQQTLAGAALRAEARELTRVLATGRQAAVDLGTRVVVCSVDRAGACQRDWTGAATVFSDPNANNRLDSGERRLRHWAWGSQGNRLTWQGFGPGYLRFRSSGAAVDNGAFTLCPRSGDKRLARQVIVNRVGRVYHSRDLDGDGVVEYGEDKEPACAPAGS